MTHTWICTIEHTLILTISQVGGMQRRHAKWMGPDLFSWTQGANGNTLGQLYGNIF